MTPPPVLQRPSCTRTYTERGDEKSEVRYFISSLSPQVQKLARAIRGHWGIENGLHWVLDMYFAEDRNRARTGNAAANLGLQSRVGGQVRRLRLDWCDGGLVLRGHSMTYYAKQLAQHAVMSATDLPVRANEIDVL